jgi:hypothetical protein
VKDEKWPVNLVCDSDLHVNRRVLLHAANLRHGTDGFTSPPKEGMLCIFAPENFDSFGWVRTRDLGHFCYLARKLQPYVMLIDFMTNSVV